MNGPTIELIHFRDPDGACTCRLFLNGLEAAGYTTFDIDPGAGHHPDAWKRTTESDVATASNDTVAEAVRLWRETASPSRYINEDHDD